MASYDLCGTLDLISKNFSVLLSSQTVDLVFLYFILIFIFISFYFLIFLFLEHRVRVSDSHESRDTENKVKRF